MAMRVFPFVGTACPRRPWEKLYSAFTIFPLLRGCSSHRGSSPRLQLLAKIRGEADRPALRDRRMHELADGREYRGDGFIMDGKLFVEPGFELCEAPGQLLVRSEHLAQLDKGAHHADAHFDGARAIQNRCGHDRAVFREDVRQVLAMLAAAGL